MKLNVSICDFISKLLDDFLAAIAGNIVPAIATTNAIVAGLAVLHAFRVLGEEYEKCNTTYVRQKSSSAKTVLMTESVLMEANPNCYVCSEKPTVNVLVNVSKMTVKEFETEVLKQNLNMIAPDVMLEGKNVVVISSEEGETEVFNNLYCVIKFLNVFFQINNDKKLKDIGIVDGSILKVDDFVQNYELTIYITEYIPKDSTEPPFVVHDSIKNMNSKEEVNGKISKLLV